MSLKIIDCLVKTSYNMNNNCYSEIWLDGNTRQEINKIIFFHGKRKIIQNLGAYLENKGEYLIKKTLHHGIIEIDNELYDKLIKLTRNIILKRRTLLENTSIISSEDIFYDFETSEILNISLDFLNLSYKTKLELIGTETEDYDLFGYQILNEYFKVKIEIKGMTNYE